MASQAGGKLVPPLSSLVGKKSANVPTSRYLFLIEGLITLTVGLASFFLMPASAVQTKTWYRPNGWFSDRELSIVVNRVLRDDPTKGRVLRHISPHPRHSKSIQAKQHLGDMHNRMAITPKRLWRSLTDYDVWPVSGFPYT